MLKSKLLCMSDVTLKGITWKLIREKNLCRDHDAFAEVRPLEQEILYDEDIKEDRAVSSIIHEVIAM